MPGLYSNILKTEENIAISGEKVLDVRGTSFQRKRLIIVFEKFLKLIELLTILNLHISRSRNYSHGLFKFAKKRFDRCVNDICTFLFAFHLVIPSSGVNFKKLRLLKNFKKYLYI